MLHGHLGEPFPPEKQTGALGLLVLTVLIIAATMFLKQHTILDVVVALAMARICWFFMYRYKVQTVVEYEEV